MHCGMRYSRWLSFQQECQRARKFAVPHEAAGLQSRPTLRRIKFAGRAHGKLRHGLSLISVRQRKYEKSGTVAGDGGQMTGNARQSPLPSALQACG